MGFSTNYIGNPIVQNGGNDVANAFMRVYGINLKSIGALNNGVYFGATSGVRMVGLNILLNPNIDTLLVNNYNL